MDNNFQTIISGNWNNPDTGKPIGRLIEHIVIGDVASHIVDIIERLEWAKQTIMIVCDENGFAVLGRHVLQQLRCAHIVLPADVEPTEAVIKKVQQAFGSCNAVLAVGSGTINDICKYASYLSKKPYAVLATAPSMNGYASKNASIIRQDGFRTSVQAHLPLGIFMDLEILMHAPLRLIQSGVGDLLCRTTAQADWLLSHYIMDTTYYSAPFVMMQDAERKLFSSVQKLLQYDEATMAILAELLLLSGLGMTLSGGSYPASQAEHMIAHTMEMVYGAQLPPTYHGEQIGVTTLFMSRMQFHKINSAWQESSFANDAITEDEVKQFFGKKMSSECVAVYQKKRACLSTIKKRISTAEDDIKEKIYSIMIETDLLEGVLDGVKAPTTLKAIGWPDKKIQQAIKFCRYSRERWTFLDV